MAKKETEPTSSDSNYLHGYSKIEQKRLIEQARFLENKVYEHVDLNKFNRILELGCGVGAQSDILLRRFPNIHLTSVDRSADQIRAAKVNLKHWIEDNRVELMKSDGEKLAFGDSTFDAVFICWLLEHVPEPKKILEESHRLLRSGGRILCTEVLNATLYLHPYSPATLQYWFAFNDHQWNIKGDPFVGAKLGGMLHDVGFQDITVRNVIFHYDSRSPKMRSMMFEYWTKLLLSGAPSLVAAKRVNQNLVSEMTAELNSLKNDRDAVFYYSAVQAEGSVF